MFGIFYRPPSSSNEILEKLDDSIGLALGNDVSHVIIAGDFNLNFLDSASRNKLLSIVNQYSLCQIIDEPTYFTETSSSITDLFFTRNPDNVIVSGVGEAFLNQNIRYHCLVYAVFKFDNPKHHCYKRKIWKYDNGDHEGLKQLIHDFDWQSLKDHNINVYVENFTNKFLELCKMTIPNKFITIRPSDPPWFNGLVRKLIRRRKRAHKKAKRLDTAGSWRAFRKLRNEVIAAIKASKYNLKNKLVNNLKSGNLSGKDWWRTFKSLIDMEKLHPFHP